MTGRRAAQGRATSKLAANVTNTSSRPGCPTNCTPMGTPSSVQLSGNDIAGWPVTLNCGVKGIVAANFDVRSRSEPLVRKPHVGGGVARVGSTNTSKPPAHHATSFRDHQIGRAHV